MSTRTDLTYRDVRLDKLDLKKEFKVLSETKAGKVIVKGSKKTWEDIKEGSSAIAGGVGSIPVSLNLMGEKPITVGETLESARNLFTTGVRVGVEQVSFYGKEAGKVLEGKQSLQEFGSMFIPKKRPDVVISLDEGVIRETTTEERKPITVFDIEKTTPKTQAVSKGVEFVSYFTPAFVPLVTGDIAKSSEEIKRIRVREDLTSTQKEELIGKEKQK